MPCRYATLAGSGQWDWFMGAHDTGWIGALGLIHEGASWWAHNTGWIGAMALIYGGMPWWRVTLAGMGRWDWFTGAPHGGAWHWLDWGHGIYGGTPWGTWHWLDRGDGIDLWVCAMGACGAGWIGAIGLIYRDTSWGRTIGLRRWDWFVCVCVGGGGHNGGVRHWLDRGNGIDLWGHTTLAGSMGLVYESVQHWLDRGSGIDLWEPAMGARGTGWNGAMGLIYGGVPNGARQMTKHYMVAEIKWWYHVSSCLALR